MFKLQRDWIEARWAAFLRLIAPEREKRVVARRLLACSGHVDRTPVAREDLVEGHWPDFYIRVCGQTFGYIKDVEIAPPYLVVRHFAINGGRERRKGSGRAMLRGLSELALGLGVETIIFWQVRPKPEHVMFFNGMKMTPLTMKANHASAYLWRTTDNHEEARAAQALNANTTPGWNLDSYIVEEKIAASLASAQGTNDVRGVAIRRLNAQVALLQRTGGLELDALEGAAETALIKLKTRQEP